MERKTITIDEETYEKIQKHNREHGSTVSSVIKLALIKFFNKEKSKKGKKGGKS